LRVPNYAILDLQTGTLEFYRLDSSGRYQLETLDEHQRYWIPELKLALGVRQGTKENRSGLWLRWWDEAGNLLLWGSELVEQERQRSLRLAEKLRSLGVDPEQL
jgi:hypothetical protein